MTPASVAMPRPPPTTAAIHSMVPSSSFLPHLQGGASGRLELGMQVCAQTLEVWQCMQHPSMAVAEWLAVLQITRNANDAGSAHRRLLLLVCRMKIVMMKNVSITNKGRSHNARRKLCWERSTKVRTSPKMMLRMMAEHIGLMNLRKQQHLMPGALDNMSLNPYC